MIGTYLKRLLPRTLYGRAAAILLLPMLTLQLAVTAVFVQRHFEDVTVQMTNNLLFEIKMVLDELNNRSISNVAGTMAQSLRLELRSWDGVISENSPVFYDISGRTITPLIFEKLPKVYDIDLSDLDQVSVGMESAKGLIKIVFARNRVSASNPHQVLVLMVFTGIFMTVIAFFFLRNQLRPIKRLSLASAAFGRGQSVAFNPTGAIEVRAAGHAFLDMRDRIERQIEQRTMMLSGVSHDLRTPITRLQLGLELLDGPEVQDLKKDVDSMRFMVDSFLNYARDSAADPVADVDLVDLLTELGLRLSPPVKPRVVGSPRLLALRQVPVARALDNLLTNALRYADCVQILIRFETQDISIFVSDNGPGIPADQRDQAIKPFVRLEAARGQNHGSGVGLGLAIAADVAKSHGGSLILNDSAELGGLSVEVRLPL
ncbi:MAG: ATP-binding protein [Planktomarina sp.]|jgi:two-component system osmolarity sensor histidine kinase EnvZ|nr:ATP-binding protein [Planktomarina sp.]MDT2058780.1 ATP-binding protein [Planktomarina sp.]MDT2078996.1 ATP-binding protein [Planktomarina sp.]|tara:strand:- start:507 stop:1799 length:1293 start_codon:yes stop_codon:yes gene_type:complete